MVGGRRRSDSFVCSTLFSTLGVMSAVMLGFIVFAIAFLSGETLTVRITAWLFPIPGNPRGGDPLSFYFVLSRLSACFFTLSVAKIVSSTFTGMRFFVTASSGRVLLFLTVYALHSFSSYSTFFVTFTSLSRTRYQWHVLAPGELFSNGRTYLNSLRARRCVDPSSPVGIFSLSVVGSLLPSVRDSTLCCWYCSCFLLLC